MYWGTIHYYTNMFNVFFWIALALWAVVWGCGAGGWAPGKNPLLHAVFAFVTILLLGIKTYPFHG